MQKTNGLLTNSPKVFAEAQVTINNILNGHNMSQNCFNKKKSIFPDSNCQCSGSRGRLCTWTLKRKPSAKQPSGYWDQVRGDWKTEFHLIESWIESPLFQSIFEGLNGFKKVRIRRPKCQMATWAMDWKL